MLVARNSRRETKAKGSTQFNRVPVSNGTNLSSKKDECKIREIIIITSRVFFPPPPFVFYVVFGSLTRRFGRNSTSVRLGENRARSVRGGANKRYSLVVDRARLLPSRTETRTALDFARLVPNRFEVTAKPFCLYISSGARYQQDGR